VPTRAALPATGATNNRTCRLTFVPPIAKLWWHVQPCWPPDGDAQGARAPGIEPVDADPVAASLQVTPPPTLQQAER